ncbi:hypothetical protein B0H19DRAFT_112808 [Mycena capillaripes]|nr:hypothetical protein B0H19DRAFT_112808 [Mycena capillaripes]
MSNDHLRTRLAELSEVIATHEALLKELQRDRTLVQQQLNSIVYPVLTLPLDITLEIFGHCNSLHNPLHAPTFWSPAILLRTCKTWREIALNSSTLWTRLRLDLWEKKKSYGHQWHSGEVERYLAGRIALARGRPLSVNLCGHFVKCLGGAGFSTLIRRLAPQLQSLTLDVEAKGFVELDREPPTFRC